MKHGSFFKAMEVATRAHEGQKYGDMSYMYHINAVVNKVVAVYETDETLMTVAALHDTLEDTDVTDYILFSEGFSDAVIEAVQAISRGKTESHNGYIRRVKKNDIAHKVKICDTLCNLEESVKSHNKNRVVRYSNQLAELYK